MRGTAFLAAIAAAAALALPLTAQDSSDGRKLNLDPDLANLVTSDLDNFWRAYALAAAAGNTADRTAQVRPMPGRFVVGLVQRLQQQLLLSRHHGRPPWNSIRWKAADSLQSPIGK